MDLAQPGGFGVFARLEAAARQSPLAAVTAQRLEPPRQNEAGSTLLVRQQDHAHRCVAQITRRENSRWQAGQIVRNTLPQLRGEGKAGLF